MRATLMWVSVEVVSGVRIVQCHSTIDLVIDVRVMQCHAIIDVVIDVRVMQCHASMDVVIGVRVVLCHRAIDHSEFSTSCPNSHLVIKLYPFIIIFPVAILVHTFLHRENTSFEVWYLQPTMSSNVEDGTSTRDASMRPQHLRLCATLGPKKWSIAPQRASSLFCPGLAMIFLDSGSSHQTQSPLRGAVFLSNSEGRPLAPRATR